MTPEDIATSIAGRLALIGGVLCLDFVNTAEGRGSDRLIEFLGRYADLVAWSAHVGILTERDVYLLMKEASARPHEADAVLRRARERRELLYQLLAAADSEAPPPLSFWSSIACSMKRSSIWE